MEATTGALRTEGGEPEILVDRQGYVAVVTLNRPHRRNAIAIPMLRRLTSCLEELDADDDVRAVVLTGAGGAFCAGLDLKSLANTERRGGDAGASMQDAVANASDDDLPPIVLHHLSKPTIAAVSGAAAGYGFDLALGCDLRVVGRSAKLLPNFVTRGVVPESGGTWLLPRLVGWARACELVFCGDAVPPDDALAMGLVNRVVDDGEVLDAALELARRVAENAPLAVRAAKALMHHGENDGFADHVHRVLGVTKDLFGTADFQEGVRAFAERRPPVFAGH